MQCNVPGHQNSFKNSEAPKIGLSFETRHRSRQWANSKRWGKNQVAEKVIKGDRSGCRPTTKQRGRVERDREAEETRRK
jgi:hypothetical protein